MTGMKFASSVVLTGTLLWAGCGGRNRSLAPAQSLPSGNVSKAAAVQAVHDVLSGMYFAIEKLDVEQGIVRTRPLRGAQFFEFWRADNASGSAAAEANLQTVRRTAEVRVTTADAPPQPEDANVPTLVIPPSGLRLTCTVSVQRLSLPASETPIASQTIGLHSRTTDTGRQVAVPARRERTMAWVDLGPDPDLARTILTRVHQKLERSDL